MSYLAIDGGDEVERVCDLCLSAQRDVSFMFEARRGLVHVCDRCVDEMARQLAEWREGSEDDG